MDKAARLSRVVRQMKNNKKETTMTGIEARNLANAVLGSVGEPAISLPDLSGTEREQIKAVIRAYAARLRENQPRYSKIKDDWMLPDMVIQKLREELEKTN